MTLNNLAWQFNGATTECIADAEFSLHCWSCFIYRNKSRTVSKSSSLQVSLCIEMSVSCPEVIMYKSGPYPLSNTNVFAPVSEILRFTIENISLLKTNLSSL